MDLEPLAILQELNLMAYAEAFEVNKVSQQHLPFLIENDAYLERLIPNFGDRLNFAASVKSKLTVNNRSISGQSLSSVASSQSVSSLASTSSQSSNHPIVITVESVNGEGENFMESVTQVDEIFDLVQESEEDPIVPTRKRRRQERESVRSWNLKSVIRPMVSKTIGGLALVASFDHRKVFDNSSRSKLAHIIICQEFGTNPNTEITSSRFKELAAAISEEFPGEDSKTWYTPSITPPDGKTTIPKGKLYDQYTVTCKDLRDSHLRESRKRKTELRTQTPRSLPLLPECDLTHEEIEKRLEFLSENIEPWDLVRENWTITINRRQTDLRNGTDDNQDIVNLFTFEYINKYPALKQPLAHTLLEIDFKALYPTSHGRIFTYWEAFLEKLKLQLNIEAVKHSGFVSDAEWLHAFAGLFSSVPIKVPKNKWKPAKTEILDGFLLHLKDIADWKKTLQFITQRNKSRGLPVQPFPMVVGKTLKTITQNYFVIDGTPLLLESTKQAVAVAFYAYHALYTSYPSQSARVWVTLERALFCVDDPYDTQSEAISKFPEVRRLISALKV